jgi:hypothetical protein
MILSIFSMQPTSWIKFFKNYIRYLIKNHSVAVLPQIFKHKNFDINVDLHWAKLDDSDSMTREDYIGDKFLINWITVGKVPPKHVSTSMLTLISMWSTRSERDEIVYLEIKTCLYIGWHACNNSGPFFYVFSRQFRRLRNHEGCDAVVEDLHGGWQGLVERGEAQWWRLHEI